jgi:cytochrome c553
MRNRAMGKSWIVMMALLVGSAVHAADPQAGKAKADKQCAACHGTNGLSVSPDFPHLAGQHHDYLVHSLRQYQSGARKNPIMAGQVANLSRADIEDLAAFYASQRGLATKR